MSSHDEDQAEAARVLGQVLTVLLDATDPTTASLWLLTPTPGGDGLAAVDAIRKSREAGQRVLAEARRDSSRWSH